MTTSEFAMDNFREQQRLRILFNGEQNMLASLVQYSNDAIVALTLDGTVLTWNDGAERIYGYTSTEMIGKPASILLPHDREKEVADMINKIANREINEHCYTKRIRKDGTIIDVSDTVSPIEDDQGLIVAISSIARDVTVHKETVLQSAHYTKELIEPSLDPLVMINPDGKITDVNEATIRVTGHTRQELVGSDFSNYFTEVEKGYQQVFSKGFVADYPLSIRDKDGKLTDVLYKASVYKDTLGNVLGVLAVAQDITVKNKTEKVAEDQRTREMIQTEQAKTLEKFRRMATVIQDSNDAITFQDLEGNILAWNRGAELMYGYSEAEALKMNIVDTVPKEYQAEAREFLASLKRGELVATLETKRKTKDGKILDVWLANTKLTDDKGNLTGIATTERDVTERMESLEKFRRMATVIKDSNDAITIQDLEGNILAWNRGAELMYGYSEAEALKMNIVDTVPKEYQAEAREFLASLKRGELVATLNTKRKTKNGKIVDVWLTNTKLTDDKGKLTGIATTERDVTFQKQAEKEVTEQRAREIDRIVELERFQKLTVGRELKMIELKKEIEEMKKHNVKIGEP